MIAAIYKKYKQIPNMKYVMRIILVYLFSQGFLLIVTGMWWDDWDYANKSWDYLYESFRQSSLPLRAYIQASLWFLPDGAYRILVFIYFLLGAFLLFNILQKLEFISFKDAYTITLLYVVMPINDARITWICYGYSLSLLIFWLTFYLVIGWYNRGKSILMRVLLLGLLLLSYDTESIMSMTLLILLYLYYEDLRGKLKHNPIRDICKECLRVIISYGDFLVAPILFYVIKHKLFPAGGIYAGHNYIPWNSMISIMVKMPCNALLTLKNVLDRYYSIFNTNSLFVFLAIVIVVAAYLISNKTDMDMEEEVGSKKTVWLLALAFLVFLIGLLPYAILVNGDIKIMGTGGRHSLLLGLGLAMILYYTIGLCVRKKAQKVAYFIIILLGVLHFNLMYLEYQEDYYQQLRFRTAVSNCGDIIDNDTFLCLNQYPAFIEAYYQYNGNSWIATGEESRYFLDSTFDLSRLEDMGKDSFILKGSNMREWNCSPENLFIDGIVIIHNEPIGIEDLIRLKLLEMFNHSLFEKWIADTSGITYIPVTKEESESLIEASRQGKLTQDNLTDYLERD